MRIKLPGLWNSWVNHLCMSPRSVLQSILRVGGKQHLALRREEISTPKPSRQITPHARCRKHVCQKKKRIMFIFWKEPSDALGVRNNTMLWICQSDTTIRFHPRRRANENILSYLLVPVHWSIIQIQGSQKTPLQICIQIKAALFVCSPNQAHGPLRNSGTTNSCTVQMSSSGQTPRPNPPSIFITSQD